MKEKVKIETLPGYDGKTAYCGALRLLDKGDIDWISKWAAGNEGCLPGLDFFAADAFGVLYGVNEGGVVSIFWTETGCLEDIGITRDEFFMLVCEDPNSTINYSLYIEAVAKIGKPNHDQNFSLKVETALGGKMSVDNLYICDKSIHMLQLGKIARQIKDYPVGTVFIDTDF
ncbi:hypothetical protein B1992_14995 [Pseudoxanthomonas broegbernensis]|uniref:T6SS immunity protein Tdi1 C-terminal domain-containing protein n=1 Tax=Pseudoxanthomonas broegbernensis TaxID=83619 RepID=A0A7V8GJY8_9GAMM|nr:T6SS immunity protein Tdi1 domain-containing protein [Pseudoxanthomonas broegbernensis]KAF1684536.1 hypothetical protein B1992_14995 [Pseudoxanthomonas broegbernensis]MBB6066490.1 hypothetical protein [Pseudoxanthomonas broegbernensis]